MSEEPNARKFSANQRPVNCPKLTAFISYFEFLSTELRLLEKILTQQSVRRAAWMITNPPSPTLTRKDESFLWPKVIPIKKIK